MRLRIWDKPAAKYLVAVVITLFASLLRWLLYPVLHDKQPFLFASLAVILISIYIGLGPALIAIAFSLVITVPFILSPTHSMELGPDTVCGVISYAAVAIAISVLAHRQKVARELALQRAKEITRLNEDLEQRVIERTKELEEANQDLAGFSYSIAHDMRQYLRGINVNAHLVIEDLGDRVDEEGKESLRSLSRNAKQANALVEGLLEFSRLGKDGLILSTASVSSLAEDVWRRVSRNCSKEPSISVQPNMSAMVDQRLLELALQNLIENALKYQPAGQHPSVQIGAFERSGETIFFVADNGIGFDMRFVQHIFLPFERLHRQTEYLGTGIGLANVKRIVEKHGGRIWAESSVGKGATFFFTLPGGKIGSSGSSSPVLESLQDQKAA